MKVKQAMLTSSRALLLVLCLGLPVWYLALDLVCPDVPVPPRARVDVSLFSFEVQRATHTQTQG